MKHVILHAFAVSAAAMLALGTNPADAQTTAPGPYYATPSWDQTLPTNTRFVVLSNFANAAVLDRETGLVWLRSAQAVGVGSYTPMSEGCMNVTVGNRVGWRMPTVQEMMSLIDPSVTVPGFSSTPQLPTGHPFTDVTAGPYWTATQPYGRPDSVYTPRLQYDPSSPTSRPWVTFFQSVTGPAVLPAWCVRTGYGLNTQ